MAKTVYAKTYFDSQGGEVDFFVHRYDEGYATITALDADGMSHFCGRYPHMASAIKVTKVIANWAVK
jgi:hypothetical protein